MQNKTIIRYHHAPVIVTKLQTAHIKYMRIGGSWNSNTAGGNIKLQALWERVS